MTNNYNKVSPSNRVDFSRIRRHASGGGIQKYQTPANAIKYSGITQAANTSWYENVFKGFQQSLINALRTAPNEDEKRKLVEDINRMLTTYAQIHRSPDKFSPTQVEAAVKQYQTDIRNKYPYVNLEGIAGATTANRYIYKQTNPSLRGNKDNGTAGWKPDGLYSGITDDRTILGYGDAWKEGSDDLAAWLNTLKGFGLTTYMDTDHAWKLKPLNPADIKKPAIEANPDDIVKTDQKDPAIKDPAIKDPVIKDPTVKDPSIQSAGVQNPGAQGPQGPQGHGDLTPDQYYGQFKPTPWTTWIPNGMVLNNSLKANKIAYNNAMKQKTPLKEGPRQEYTLTDNYAGQQLAANQAQDLRSRANQAASSTSNLEANLGTQLSGNYQAGKAELEGQLQKQAAYNQSIKEANQVANWNNAQSVDTANWNRNSNTVNFNQKLDANSKYHTARLGAVSDNIMKNTSEYLQTKAYNERNRQYYYDQLSALNAEQDIAALRDPVTKLRDNPYSADAWNAYKAGLWSQFNNDLAISDTDLDANGKALRNLYDGFDQLTPEEQEQKIKDFTSGNEYFGNRWKTAYNDEYNRKYQSFVDASGKIKNGLAYSRLGDLDSFAFQGYWDPSYRPQVYQRQFFKEGGILKAKDGDRMVKYMESRRKAAADKEKNRIALLDANRRATKDSQDQTMKSAKQLQDSITRELESLDRETSMLLRSVFK